MSESFRFRQDFRQSRFVSYEYSNSTISEITQTGKYRTLAGASQSAAFTLTLKPFDANFRLYLLALVIFTLGNSSDLFLLAHAQKLGVPDYLLPILWGLFHVAKSGGNFFIGSWVERIGPKPMILAGWITYGIVYLLFGIATSAWHVWCLFLGYAVFYGLTEPSEKTLVATLVPTERKGLAYGWFNFALGVTTFPASLLFGWLYTWSPQAAFSTGAGLAIVASALMMTVRPHRPG